MKESGVARGWKFEAHHGEKRMDESFSLSQGQVEDEAKGEDGFNCQIGISLRSTL